jgi:hypothetical protein
MNLWKRNLAFLGNERKKKRQKVSVDVTNALGPSQLPVPVTIQIKPEKKEVKGQNMSHSSATSQKVDVDEI